MNKIPEFSIVTVCFNSEKTIKKTIESVLQQEFKDYEYIIVDGASKDGTMDVVRSYVGKFEGRLRYISEPDKGIYDAFNKGVRMSKGKYVWIVNSDDYIEPNALDELYKVSSQYTFENAPIISAGMNLCKGENVTPLFGSAEKAALAYKKDWTCSPHTSTLIPLNVYNNIGLYNDKYYIAGDKDLLRRAYKLKVPFIYIGIVVTNMVYEGISSKPNFKKDYNDHVLFLKTHYNNPFVFLYRLTIWLLKFWLTKRKY